MTVFQPDLYEIAVAQQADAAQAIKDYLHGFKDCFSDSSHPQITSEPRADGSGKWAFVISANATPGNHVLQKVRNIVIGVLAGSADVSAVESDARRRAFITIEGVPVQMNVEIFARDPRSYPQPYHLPELRKRLPDESMQASRGR